MTAPHYPTHLGRHILPPSIRPTDHRPAESHPTFSIIISTLNAGTALLKTIDSIRRQACVDYELIVADGGSSDGTIEVLSQLCNPTDCWFSGRDSGIYDAWNRALSISRGAYFLFLGAGDTLTPDGLQLLRETLQTSPETDLWLFRVRLVTAGVVLREYGQPWNWRLMQRYMAVAHTGSVHSRSLFETVGLFDPSYRICGDYELLLRSGPQLRTRFIAHVLTEMEHGGISNQSTRVFVESQRAKKKHHTRNRLQMLLDDVVQRSKFFARRGFDHLRTLWR